MRIAVVGIRRGNDGARPLVVVSVALAIGFVGTARAQQPTDTEAGKSSARSPVHLASGRVWTLSELCAEVRAQTGMEVVAHRDLADTELLLGQVSLAPGDVVALVCAVAGFQARKVEELTLIVRDARTADERYREELRQALEEQSRNLQDALRPLLSSPEVLQAGIPFDMASVLRKDTMTAAALADKQRAFLTQKATNDTLVSALRGGQEVSLKFAPFFLLELVFQRRKVTTVPGSTTQVESVRTASIRRFGAF